MCNLFKDNWKRDEQHREHNREERDEKTERRQEKAKRREEESNAETHHVFCLAYQ